MSAAFSLFPTDPPAEAAPKPVLANTGRRFLCMICKRPMVEYGEWIPGALDLCDERECLLAWCAISAKDQPVMCPCPQRPYPHELKIHEALRGESYNPQFKFRWPWSLMLSKRSEPSTEGAQHA